MKMAAFSANTREDRKIEQHRGHLGVVLLRNKEYLGSGSVVNMVPSKHFKICKEGKCLLTSGDVVLDGDSSGIDDYVIDYWDSDLKSVRELKLSHVAHSTEFFRPTSGLALIPVVPEKFPSALSFFNLKSYVLDDRRAFHTEYWIEGETQNVVSLRCFIAGSLKVSLVSSFTLISRKDEHGQLSYKLKDDHDGSIFETYGEMRTKMPHLYPRGAPILKFKKAERMEPQVTCVGVLNFSNDNNKKISPVFLRQETLTG